MLSPLFFGVPGPLRQTILIVVACVLAVAQPSCADTSTRPNILLIVADDLGFSDLGCYGGEIATPRLDQMAASGALLTRMYSTGRCCPSRAALLTGQYPHAVGLGHMTIDLKRPGYRGRVDDDAWTLGDALKRAGYRTWISGKWHLGTEDPTQHGFEQFFGTLVSCKDFWSPNRFYRIQRGQPVAWNTKNFFATDRVTDFALEFLDDARDSKKSPWFGYVAYHAPHFPLHAPADDIAKYADTYRVGWDILREERLARQKSLGLFDDDIALPPRSAYRDWASADDEVVPAWDSLPKERRRDLARRMAIYAAMVDRLDRQIGRILDDLRANGELEDTLIVFLSDNGACAEWDPFGFDGVSGPDNELHIGGRLDEMGQPGTFHSAGAGWAMASNTPFRRYKHFCHEGGVRGPCLVTWGKRIEPGRRVNTPVHLIDVMPTLLQAAHVDHAGPRDPAGISFLETIGASATLPNDSQAAVRPLYFEHEGNRAIVYGNQKLVASSGNEWEYYDLRDDPCETEDLLASERESYDAEAAKDLMEQWWSDWAQGLDVLPFPLDYGVQYLPGSSDLNQERLEDNDVRDPH